MHAGPATDADRQGEANDPETAKGKKETERAEEDPVDGRPSRQNTANRHRETSACAGQGPATRRPLCPSGHPDRGKGVDEALTHPGQIAHGWGQHTDPHRNVAQLAGELIPRRVVE